MKVLASSLVVVCVTHLAVAYSPIIDGALADVRIKVVDDVGEAVSNASVSVTFYTAPEKVDIKRGTSDVQGCFSARGMCIGEAHAWIRKDGHYDTKVDPIFQTLPNGEVQSSRKWSEGEVQTVVTLKRKRRPVALLLSRRQYWPFPATNEVFAIDLETLQWCPPYGKGRHADLELFYEAVEHPEEGWGVSYWNRLTLNMPNAVDGFYAAKMDSFSKFPYAYRADTNAVFSKSLVLEIERKNDRMVKVDLLPEDEYLVFRTRTSTNGLGQVTHANYGRIGENLNLAIGLSMKSWFNPTVNDTNLEDARAK